MTMLDQMRRHKSWLKWSLGFVALALGIFFIPNFLVQNPAGAISGETVATIEGRDITAGDFRRTYDAQLQAYRNAYGGNVSEQLLKQLGIDQQIIQQLVDQQAALAEAERLGVRASDEEVRQRIFATPAFQENGAFIGEQRYQQLLRAQRPPMTPAQFENAMRDDLVIEKLQALLTDWLSVTDTELEQEYRARNDKVKLAVASFMADSFKTDATASDAEVAAHFAQRAADFTIPEKRKVRFLLVDIDALRAKAVVPEAEIARAYNENIQQYSTPEQVRASHILLRTEGKDDAAVKAKAEDILKQARAGADFAQLARTHSEDEPTAKNGGDLDYFGRGRMVPEFDQAAFALEPGQTSDVIKTEYGYHIIKLADKKPATMRALAEVRSQLVEQLGYQKAQAQASDLAQMIAGEVASPADLDKAAQTHGLAVQESEFFARDGQIAGLGASPEAVARAFELKPNEEAAGPLTASRGFAFITVTGTQAPYVPKLEEVTDRVRDEILKQKTRDMSRQKAADLAAKLKGAADFDRVVKAAGVEPKTTELVTRDAPLPDLGIAPEVLDAAFALEVGAVSDPITSEAGTAVVKLIEKQQVTPTEWAANKDRFRDELLADRRNRFFASYLAKAKEKMRIAVDREALQRALL
jgi:peptidyl-prolyl cis-trans isomerase D